MKNSIKLTKKHDSPYKNEPSHAYDSHPSTQIYSSHKIQCLYHKEQTITNFCKAPECLMPLCPECVKIHTEEHTKSGNYGVYETIDEVWGSIMLELNRIEDSYAKTRTRLQGLQHSNENGKAILLGRMDESKKRMMKLVDDYYRGLEAEIQEEHSIFNKEELIGMDFTQNKIMERFQEIEKFRKKLKGHKFLKYIIIFISAGIVPEHMNYNREIESYISQMDSKQPFFRDECPPNFLFDFLSQYVTLENKRDNRRIPPSPLQFPPMYLNEKMNVPPPPPPFNYYPQEMPMNIPAYAESRSPHDYNRGPIMNYENPPQFMQSQYVPPGFENPPQFLNHPTPKKTIIPGISQSVNSPQTQKGRIFPERNLGLSEYNSPYPIGISSSGNKLGGNKEGFINRSPFKTIGNLEVDKFGTQPQMEPNYRSSMNQWERP